MKKFLSTKIITLLIAVVIILSIPVAGKSATVLGSEKAYTLEEVIAIPIGNKEGQLSLGLATIGDPPPPPEPVYDSGPYSYYIAANGDVFVVDTFDKPAPIVHYSASGEYVSTIPANLFDESESGIRTVVALNNKLFVFCENIKEYDGLFVLYENLYEYDMTTGGITMHESPEYAHLNFCRAKIIINDCIVFASNNMFAETWMFDTKKSQFMSADTVFSRDYDEASHILTIKYGDVEFAIRVETPEIEMVPLGVDKDGNLIVEYAWEGISYRKYTPEGDLVGFAEEIYSDLKFYLGDRIVCVANGELFKAKCDGVNYMIDKVVFDEKYFTEYPLDLNLDNKEDTADAVILLQQLLGRIKFNIKLKYKADINRDGKLNTGDVAAMLMELVKK